MPTRQAHQFLGTAEYLLCAGVEPVCTSMDANPTPGQGQVSLTSVIKWEPVKHSPYLHYLLYVITSNILKIQWLFCSIRTGLALVLCALNKR